MDRQMAPIPPHGGKHCLHQVLTGPLPFFLTLAHRARAAFVASSFLSWGVRPAMRVFPPLPPAAFPPFLPISRMTLEIRSRLIPSSYEEWILLATFGD